MKPSPLWKRTLCFALAATVLAGSLTAFAASGGTQQPDILAMLRRGVTEYQGIQLATGATVTRRDLMDRSYTADITDFGAVPLEGRAAGDTDTHAIENTEAINRAIEDVAAHGGGTVVFPAGTFRAYTIVLKSGVNLYLDEDCTLQAAKTEMKDRSGAVTSTAEDFYPDGAPGNYLQPEVNLYAGLQDGGHTYFANSLLYGADPKVHSGASGPGCCASVLCGEILPKLAAGRLRRVLFIATGALMSQTTFLQKESIPAIAHLVELTAPGWKEDAR